MHRVVRLVGSLAGLGGALFIAPTPAGAGASAGEGPGATISVGTSAAGSSGGSPGEQGGDSRVGTASSASPWSCVYTYLALNNEGGMPLGGPMPGAWYSVTCDDRATGAQWTQTEWISSQPGGRPVGTMSARRSPRRRPASGELTGSASTSDPEQSLRHHRGQSADLALDRPIVVARRCGHCHRRFRLGHGGSDAGLGCMVHGGRRADGLFRTGHPLRRPAPGRWTDHLLLVPILAHLLAKPRPTGIRTTVPS